MRPPALALSLLLLTCAQQLPHSAAVSEAVDEAFPRLEHQYSAEQREAVSWSGDATEAWDMTGAVLDEWGPAWRATEAVVLALDSRIDPLPSFCAARELWRQRGVYVDDRGLCVYQRPCWFRPQEEK